MLSEIEVRRRIAEIEHTEENPAQKAHLLLQIAQTLNGDALRLARGMDILEGDGAEDEVKRMRTSLERLKQLSKEVTERARHLLHSNTSQGRPHSFRFRT